MTTSTATARLDYSFRAFRVPNVDTAEDKTQDAYVAATHIPAPGSAEACARFAVADGSGQSFVPWIWAQVMVEQFLQCGPPPSQRGRITSEDWATWLDYPHQRWIAGVEAMQQALKAANSNLAWVYNNNVMERRPAASTIVALEFFDQQQDAATPAGTRWEASIVGDSCLFHLRDQKLTSYPNLASTEFGKFPLALRSYPAENLAKLPEAQIVYGTAQPGDVFILATDALAKWIATCWEERTEDYGREWVKLLDMAQPQEFADFVHGHRANGDPMPLEEDDTTMVVIRVSAKGSSLEPATLISGAAAPPAWGTVAPGAWPRPAAQTQPAPQADGSPNPATPEHLSANGAPIAQAPRAAAAAIAVAAAAAPSRADASPAPSSLLKPAPAPAASPAPASLAVPGPASAPSAPTPASRPQSSPQPVAQQSPARNDPQASPQITKQAAPAGWKFYVAAIIVVLCFSFLALALTLGWTFFEKTQVGADVVKLRKELEQSKKEKEAIDSEYTKLNEKYNNANKAREEAEKKGLALEKLQKDDKSLKIAMPTRAEEHKLPETSLPALVQKGHMTETGGAKPHAIKMELEVKDKKKLVISATGYNDNVKVVWEINDFQGAPATDGTQSTGTSQDRQGMQAPGAGGANGGGQPRPDQTPPTTTPNPIIQPAPTPEKPNVSPLPGAPPGRQYRRVPTKSRSPEFESTDFDNNSNSRPDRITRSYRSEDTAPLKEGRWELDDKELLKNHRIYTAENAPKSKEMNQHYWRD